MSDYLDTEGYDPEKPQPFLSRPEKIKVSDDAQEDVEYEALPRVDDLEGYNRIVNMADMIRLDADILQWLIANGLDYERRANSILRRAMVLERGLMPPDLPVKNI